MTAQPIAPLEPTAPTQLLSLPLERIEPHPRNVRLDVGDVEELADSIRAKGVLQPLLVAPLVELGKPRLASATRYVLIAGHRRRAAAYLAGLREVPCVVRVDLTSEADQLEAMLVENLQRTDLTVLEEGDAYQALLDLGDDVKRISAKTGRSARTVKDRLAIAHLPDASRDRVSQGQVTIEQAVALADFAGAPGFEQLEKSAGTPNWPYALRRAKENREADREATKTVRAAKKAGVTVMPGDTDVEHVVLDRLGWVAGGGRREGLSDEEHATCPGHVLVDGRDWNGARAISAACTQPDLHPREEPEPDPEFEARRAAEEKQRADLLTAATVRRAHLADVLWSRADDVALPVMRAIVQEALGKLGGWPRHPLVEVLGLDAGADLRALRARVADLDLGRLVVVLDVLSHIGSECTLERVNAWPGGAEGSWWTDTTEDWRTHLVDVYGYQWSDVEAGLLELSERAQP